MKVLHTSDWHLGATLYTKRRYDEAEQFLAWLVDTIRKEVIDVLLIAGDVFDTTLASNRAQELYYRFLQEASNTCCSDIIITAGNHDSPTFLDAPKALLKALNIHVIASVPEHIEDEIIPIHDTEGNMRALVAAVPFLHDRDIRHAEDGETLSDKQEKLIGGIREHYEHAYTICSRIRETLPHTVPLIAMGHLFCAGGAVREDDGVRDLYVGSLAHIPASLLPSGFDYYAFGHLHSPQKVAGNEFIRYSGAPLPMGFSEADTKKSVILLEIDDTKKHTREIPVPIFHPLARITGDDESIPAKIEQLVREGRGVYLEIENTSSRPSALHREDFEAMVQGSKVEILSLKNTMMRNTILKGAFIEESLDDIDEYQVFDRLLTDQKIEDDQRSILTDMYREILHSLQSDDVNRE